MFRLNTGSSDRKPSRTGSKGGLKALASRLKPELRLALDTDVSRHQGGVPEEVLPYETGSQGPGFRQPVSILSEKKSAKPTGLRRQLENRDGTQAGPVRNDSVNTYATSTYNGLPSRPDVNREHSRGQDFKATNNLAAPALHSRVKGLRPSPLKLTDISPSDRVISIGIAVPSAAVSNHTTSPHTATTDDYSPPQYGREATTPTIVVTPAKEDFDFVPPSYLTLDGHDGRPASSVYSRYTNCAPRTSDYTATPPVPPLPLFAQQLREKTVADAKLPLYEEARSATSHKATLSVCTVFEEDEQLQPPMSARNFSGHKMRSLKRQSTLPTPRRSRGWWNVLTSPFSARSNGPFWKSPTDDNPDRTAIMSDASAMGVADAARDELSRSQTAVDELEPHSAPASRLSAVPGTEPRSAPKRSVTAPGALDPSADVVNIYRVPSQGTAAAYYDQTRHFPSLLIESADSVPRSVFEDDSPLTDVCACEHHRHGRASDGKVAVSTAGQIRRANTCSSHSASVKGGAVADSEDLKSPFDDSHAVEDRAGPTNTPPRMMFSSPTATELQSPSPIHTVPTRQPTKAAADNRVSAVSSTPVIENAHFATVVGPRSSNGEQREVIIPPSRAPTPPNETVGLKAATMSSQEAQSREVNEAPAQYAHYDSPRSSMDSHEGTRGLGISNSQQDLFPPPKLLSEKPRLGTDRFGQLVILREEKRGPTQPWYRRFFWLLFTACVTLLLLLIVLLVALIPQVHADNGVQAQWLNLTGFPPLPTGVATVIQPRKSLEESSCIDPPGLWSCDAPRTQAAPDSASLLPNFRFEIRFRNHTVDNATSLFPAANYSTSSSGPVSVKSQLRARSIWSQTLYSPNPPPPSEADQLALGATKDHVSAPYNGEETPFYISLLSPEPLPHMERDTDKINKRDISPEPEPKTNPYPYPTKPSTTSNTTSTTTASSQPTSTSTKIPRPLLRPDSRPAPQLLYPFATAQPLRLYNRGLEDEHYGFYTYFGKSVLVANASSTSTSASNSSPSSNLTSTVVAATANQQAQALCTFAQTRFRVQIWTRKGGFVSGSSSGLKVDGTSGLASDDTTTPPPAWRSSANEMQAPGSFPYRTNFALDRESGGGDGDGAGDRGTYCWGLDSEGKVVGEGARIAEGEVGGGLEERAVGDDVGSGKGAGSNQCACAWDS